MLKKLAILILTLLLLFQVSFITADPWGKDADLCEYVYTPTCVACEPSACTTPILGDFGEIMIHFHQNTISPADGPRSHFIPSSSQYTLDAMRKYGFFRGFTLGCDRLMRENNDPWIYRKINNDSGQLMKWDPVR
jgi:putative component of membrane protein insertase Oxa1/YidC/SpoIIIJ protein YidD